MMRSRARWFVRLIVIELVLIYLVILAGSIVRATGSGMGCPDWPKCFGYIIPPIQKEEVVFHPNQQYKKGVFIVHNEALYRARRTFTSGTTFQEADWEKYTVHDYAIFNPIHTWIEYLNRLLGALSGIPMLLIAFLSLSFWKRLKIIPILAFTGVFLLGFVAWLGKKVVDGNLIPHSITLHMLGALSIVSVLLALLLFTRKTLKTDLTLDRSLRHWLGAAVLLTVLQIVLGTQVREQVDHLNKELMGLNRETWLTTIGLKFYLHRSFSIIILLVNGFIFMRNRSLKKPLTLINFMMATLITEILAGVVLAYFALPAVAQPVHMILAALLYGIQFYLWLMHMIERVSDLETSTTNTIFIFQNSGIISELQSTDKITSEKK
ncbi:cytochrome oxidase assembly protein [Thermaurantimonas aggregans]|uniref:Cytochrome oxidase assembly protein n=1 Tax=Thermaurantimonas aggregans TaxID=2173829 RepID=A0A401XKB4_9FLAO|nr:COX15/CtaA family protein [Thermaurantimonas aggregans]GCD77411.1 cytochrome oxidase assembly protein [Thermaurantimonas aggregans]